MSGRVVLLAGPGESTNIVANALARAHPSLTVILEERVARREFLRRRARKLGYVETAGQVLFMAAIHPLLRRRARERIAAIKREHGLDDGPVRAPVVRVASVNSDEGRAALVRAAPDVVVLNGTRIVTKATLAAVRAPFLNMHAGITPAYRGVHGGYWALAEGRTDLVGTTVHVVDPGIDTGAVLEQVTFAPTPADNFATYPLLHLAAGVPALLRQVDAALRGELATRPPLAAHAPLRSHPTAWSYAARRVTRGVR